MAICKNCGESWQPISHVCKPADAEMDVFRIEFREKDGGCFDDVKVNGKGMKYREAGKYICDIIDRQAKRIQALEAEDYDLDMSTAVRAKEFWEECTTWFDSLTVPQQNDVYKYKGESAIRAGLRHIQYLFQDYENVATLRSVLDRQAKQIKFKDTAISRLKDKTKYQSRELNRFAEIRKKHERKFATVKGQLKEQADQITNLKAERK